MVDESYALRAGTSEYIVARTGTECTINVPMSFFSPRRDGEYTHRWVRRVSWLLYLDLNKISQVKSVSISTTRKVIIIQMDQPDSWDNIVHDIRDAFQAHLRRKKNGEYGS